MLLREAFAGAACVTSMLLVHCGSFGRDDTASSDGGSPPDTATVKDGAARYADAVAADRPIAWYRFDDAEGDAIGAGLYDEIGKKRTGIIHGTPQFGRPGAVGTAIAFAAAWVELPPLPFVDRAPFTIELWVKLDDPNGFQHVLTNQTRTADKTGWALVQNQEVSFERYIAGQAKYTQGGIVASTGRFTHVAVTYDGTVVRFYGDGAPLKTFDDSRAMPAPTTPLVAAAADPGGGLAFKGEIDELAFYDHPLTGTRIQAHIAATR